MKGVTREEAVFYLLSLQDQINLIAQYRKDEYDQIVSLQKGDSFYIKLVFTYILYLLIYMVPTFNTLNMKNKQQLPKATSHDFLKSYSRCLRVVLAENLDSGI